MNSTRYLWYLIPLSVATQGVSGQVKVRMQEAVDSDKYLYRRPLLLFPEVYLLPSATSLDPWE